MLVFNKATDAHLIALQEMARRIIRHNYTPFLGSTLVDGFINSGASDAEIEAGLPHCWVASIEDTIVGFTILYDSMLHLIMVDVPCQQKGYGTKMLRHAEAVVFKEYEKMQLQSFEKNVLANIFYMKNGYQLIETVFVQDIGQSMTSFEKQDAKDKIAFCGGYE